MSYPPPQGGFPYPPNPSYPGNQGNAGFSQPNQGPGYPTSFQEGAGFPYQNPTPSYGLSGASSSTPYPLYPSTQPNPIPAPYPPQSNYAPYHPLSSPDHVSHPSYSSPYTSPYPSQPGSLSYPGASAPVPTNYSQQSTLNSAPYPPQFLQYPAPYQPQSIQYPPQIGGSAAASYAPQSSSPSAFSPQNFPDASPHPAQTSSLTSQFSAGASSFPSVPQGGASYPASQGFSRSSNLGASPYQSNASANNQLSYGCMWPYQERPTLRPGPSFDPSSDAAQLKKAMKGFGTDEATIIRILGRRTAQQRQDILLRYQQSFGKDLVKDLRSELSGDLRNVVASLMTAMPLFLAQQLHDAVAGLGTKEHTLVEILCTSDNNALRNIKASYQTTYKKPLEADLRGDTSGYFGRLMVAMAAAYRDESNNVSVAPGLAQSLLKAGVKKVGTDEAEFIRILSSYSYPVLRCVFEEYQKISGGKTFESAIKSELSGDFQVAMHAVYDCINNRAAYFAKCLHGAMRGFGTQDQTLTRILIWRSEVDMGNVKDEFRKAYGKRLEDAISSETSGDYKKILLALIQD